MPPVSSMLEQQEPGSCAMVGHICKGQEHLAPTGIWTDLQDLACNLQPWSANVEGKVLLPLREVFIAPPVLPRVL